VGMFVEILYHIRKYPGISVWSVYPFDYYIDEFGWPTLRQILDDESVLIDHINRNERCYYFRNGATWTFKAFDDENKVRGFSCNILHFCEMAELAATTTSRGGPFSMR